MATRSFSQRFSQTVVSRLMRLHNDAAQHAGNTPYRMLDAWRGVAALWVVVLHARGVVPAAQLASLPGPVYHVIISGYLGVPMFFVVSGYCIAHSAVRSLSAPGPVTRFLKARVKRIYPPYYLVSLLAVALYLVRMALIHRHAVQYKATSEAPDLFHEGWRFYAATISLTQVPLHTDKIIPFLWSMSYEITFYVVVGVVLLGAVRMQRAALLLDALGVLTVGSLLWLNLAGSRCPFPWNLWPQFGLGVLTYQILAQPARVGPRWVFAACGILIAWVAHQHINEEAAFGVVGGLDTLFCLGFAVVLLALFRWDDRLSGRWPVRAFAWVGLFSYSLYLVHYLALGAMNQAATWIPGTTRHPFLLYGFELAACVLVGRVFFHFCERPFLDTRQRQARREAKDAASG